MSLQWKRRKMLAMRAKKTEEKKELSLDYKSKICEAAYFGKKGYTIPKSVLDANDLNSLYNELKVKPITSGAVYNASVDEGVFPVYRENQNKIYIPRFYGIERYGLPHRSEITNGENIHVEFPKPLRDYQDKIIDGNHIRIQGVVISHIGDSTDRMIQIAWRGAYNLTSFTELSSNPEATQLFETGTIYTLDESNNQEDIANVTLNT